MNAGPTPDSHSETMTKKVIRAEIALLRDEWFLPVQKAALERAVIGVGQGKHWRVAAQEALVETYKDYGIEGITSLIYHPEHHAIEAGEKETS